MRDRPPLTARLWYDAAYWSSFTAFTFGFSFRRAGWANMPRTGPVLVVANHQSVIDPLVVGLGCRRYLSFLARSTLFKVPGFGRLIHSLGAVPIDRSMGKDGIQNVLDALGAGRAVLMFPEGERTHTGAVQPLKPGVSLLIKRLTCPIVPVGVAGCFEAWSRFRRLPTFAPLVSEPLPGAVAVSVGAPIEPGRYAGKPRDWVVADLHRELVAQHAAAEQLRRK
jgi:1-acyl-sn-glycerol-3-phosphate acyltransferase